MNMHLYENYKDTGNAWLGKVPSKWEVRRADFVVKSRKLQVSPSDLQNVDVYHYAIPNVQSTGAGAVEDGESIDSGKLVINERQVLVSKLNPRKATVTIAEPHAEYLTVASTEFVPLIPSDAHIGYMFYVWKSQKVTHRLSSFVQSVTRSHQRCEPADITKIPWAWPTLDEQHKIATFLDRKTAEIDTLIAKKRRLLALLAEKRTALITRAVTKGLNPNVSMKDSGIEWLGEIPVHWDVTSFRWRCSVTSGQVDPRDPEYAILPLIAPDHIESNTGRLLEVTSAEVQGAISGKYYFPEGTLLYSKIRPNLSKVCIAPFAGLCSADMYPVLTSRHLMSKYLMYQLLADRFKSYAVMQSLRVAMPKLNRDALGSASITIPPISEQEVIVDYVDQIWREIDSVSGKVQKVICKLQEYRSALITNAVTGQIKVA